MSPRSRSLPYRWGPGRGLGSTWTRWTIAHCRPSSIWSTLTTQARRTVAQISPPPEDKRCGFDQQGRAYLLRCSRKLASSSRIVAAHREEPSMAATARLGALEGRRHSRSPSCGLRLNGARGRVRRLLPLRSARITAWGRLAIEVRRPRPIFNCGLSSAVLVLVQRGLNNTGQSMM